MQVGLHDQGQRHNLKFEPAAHKWKTQSAGTGFLIGHQTGLPGVLADVFVKKWERGPAPGQRLMMQSIHQPLPNTPRILGHLESSANNSPGQNSGDADHYYFLENLPKRYKLLDDIISAKRVAPENAKVRLKHMLIDVNAGLNIAQAAAKFLTEVNKRNFVYPDFTQKNIMIDIDTNAVQFIDIDSCFPTSDLNPSIPDMSNKFAIVYWGAWLQAMAANQTASTLSQTMVLSFTGIWARAVAMLRSNPDDIESIQRLLRNPGYPDQQAPLWGSVIANDVASFQKFFMLQRTTDAKPCFDQWKEAIDIVRRGAPLSWEKVIAIIENTFEKVQSCPISRLNKNESRSHAKPIGTPTTQPPLPPVSSPVSSLDLRILLFSFRGGIGRKSYIFLTLIHIISLVTGVYGLDYIWTNFDQSRFTSGLIFSFFFAWPMSVVSATVRRSHDYNSTGALQAFIHGCLFATFGLIVFRESDGVMPSSELINSFIIVFWINIFLVIFNMIKKGSQ